MNREITNAKITDTELSIERGLFSMWIHVEHRNGNQAFGGYVNYTPKTPDKDSTGTWIYQILKIADVTTWNNLKGKAIRIEFDYSKIYRIGHIIKDIWFDPESHRKDKS